VLTVTFDRAVALLAEPKATRGGRGKVKEPLRKLGVHPTDDEPINIYEGPYGNYINHGKVNVGIPEGDTIESVSLETALGLLAAKQPAKKGRAKAGAKSKTTKKATTKKTPAKKVAAKKTTTKKVAAAKAEPAS
jgi:DNA topoisomerase I